MKLYGFRGEAESVEWLISDEPSLKAALRTRDVRGGNYFSLQPEADDFPCLIIRTDGHLADVGFLPDENHAGFMCTAMAPGLDPDGTSLLVFTHCDPASGELIPNVQVVSIETAVAVATHFLVTQERSPQVEWFEL